MITRRNYEIWFTDYLDGKLSVDQENTLRYFLQSNPDLADELNEMKAEIFELISDSSIFDSFSLKKNIITYDGISEENYTEKFIAYHEHDLTLAEEKSLETFLHKNPILLSELDYLGKIKVSQTGELFPRKDALKKGTAIIPIYRYAAAASVLILLGLGVARYTVHENKFTASSDMKSMKLVHTPQPIFEDENVFVKNNSSVKHITPNIRPEQESVRLKETTVSINDKDYPLLTEVHYEMPLQSSVIKFNTSPIALADDDAMSLKQIVGKLIEGGVGENAVSASLENEEKITGADVMDLAAVPFKKADDPILSTMEDKQSGKRRVKFNLGFFEADFALK